jgi:hypothetical protein
MKPIIPNPVAMRAGLSPERYDELSQRYRFIDERESTMRCPGRNCEIDYLVMFMNNTTEGDRQYYESRLENKLLRLCPVEHPDEIQLK